MPAGVTAFPGALDAVASATGFALAVNGLATLLTNNLNTSDTTVLVTSTTGFPSKGLISIGDPTSSSFEIISYTGVTATSFTGCTRGADGSTAASHATGETVASAPAAANHNDLAAAIIAAETKLGTGSSTPVSGSVLGGTGTGTSAWGTTVQIAGDGTTSSVAIGWSTDPNTGFIRPGADRLQVVNGGAVSAEFDAAGALILKALSGTPSQHGVYRDSAAKAWAKVNVAAGTPSIGASYNVTSVTDTGVGQLTVTWDRDFASTNYACIPAGDNVGAFTSAAGAGLAAGSVLLYAASAGALADPVSWSVVAYGAQA